VLWAAKYSNAVLLRWNAIAVSTITDLRIYFWLTAASLG
jgi:hypothetical protein